MFKTLNAFRFFFIIGIFLFHYTALKGSDPFFNEGYCGVTFFYILSGFLLTNRYKTEILSNNIKFTLFFINRIIKIYPLYFVTVLFFIIKSAIEHYPFWKMAIVHLLLLQSWFPNESVYLCWNYPAWFLSSLILCYILFFPTIKLIEKTKTKFIYIFLAILFIYFLSMLIVPNDYDNYLYYIFPPFRFIDFLFGILLSYLFKFIQKNNVLKNNFINNTLLVILSTTILAVTILLAPYVPITLKKESLYWIPMSLLILTLALTEGNSALSKITNFNAFQVLGSSTMCFFLIHGILLDIIRKTTGQLTPNLLLPILLAVTIISVIVYQVLNKTTDVISKVRK